MGKLKVKAFTVSLDGYAAGPHQSLQQPMGEGCERLHEWMIGTQTFRQMVLHAEGGSTGPDNDFASRSFDNLGAWIMGRNMFGPVRGAWPDASWKGWWGDEPPYHVPVFVLTHHARADLPMAGGTVFHFVTGGIHEALERAQQAAGERDIRIGGGASTVRQYLSAGLIDEMHIVTSPVVLGQGEPLFEGIDLKALGFRCTEHAGTPSALHTVLSR